MRRAFTHIGQPTIVNLPACLSQGGLACSLTTSHSAAAGLAPGLAGRAYMLA